MPLLLLGCEVAEPVVMSHASDLRLMARDHPLDSSPFVVPDSDEVLFVSGRTGVASLWLAAPGAPARPLTNRGLRQVSAGFVPVPSRELSFDGRRRRTRDLARRPRQRRGGGAAMTFARCATLLAMAGLASHAHAGSYRWPTTYGAGVTAHYDNNHGSGAAAATATRTTAAPTSASGATPTCRPARRAS